jgi:hypothetical protein
MINEKTSFVHESTKDALHNSLRAVGARTRAVYCVVFLANMPSYWQEKRLVAHPDPRHHSLARVMQSILDGVM